MIKYFHGAKLNTARTELPRTNEFERLRKRVEANDPLVKEALAAFGKYVVGLPQTKPVVPDEHYPAALGPGLTARWEAEFKDQDTSRTMFGLIVWQHFFRPTSLTWVATPPKTGNTSKRFWSYKLESEVKAAVRKEAKPKKSQPTLESKPRSFGPAVKPPPHPPKPASSGLDARGGRVEEVDEEAEEEAEEDGDDVTVAKAVRTKTEDPVFALNQCVFCRTENEFGRIIEGPRPDPDLPGLPQFRVRFAPLLSTDPTQQQKWIGAFTDIFKERRNIRPADEIECKDIEKVVNDKDDGRTPA